MHLPDVTGMAQSALLESPTAVQVQKGQEACDTALRYADRAPSGQAVPKGLLAFTLSHKPHVHASLAIAAAQSTLAAAQLPSPGLPAGLLVNSTVFLLGIQILLKGTCCPPA